MLIKRQDRKERQWQQKIFNLENLWRVKKTTSLKQSNNPLWRKNSWVQGFTKPKSFIISQITCLEPSSFSYHYSSSAKHLESTLSFDLSLFLSPQRKNLGFCPNKLDMRAIKEIEWRTQWINPFGTKDFLLKNSFSIETHKFFHKANTPKYSKRNLKLKNQGFYSHSHLSTSGKRG